MRHIIIYHSILNVHSYDTLTPKNVNGYKIGDKVFVNPLLRHRGGGWQQGTIICQNQKNILHIAIIQIKLEGQNKLNTI